MLIDLIRDFILSQRDGVSIEVLESKLRSENIDKTPYDLINESKIFKIKDGLIFFKESLTKLKEDFIKEFDDYLEPRISNKITRKDLLNNYIMHIPDVLYIKWSSLALERKLTIYELLFNMTIKPVGNRDVLKDYFNDLIDFYASFTIYSILLLNISDDDDDISRYIEQIENYDKIMEKHLFNSLTIPDVLKIDIDFWSDEFLEVKNSVKKILDKSFAIAKQYSLRLLQRVIKNEFEDFSNLILLTRLEYGSLYNWLTTIYDKKIMMFRNLFDDLDL